MKTNCFIWSHIRLVLESLVYITSETSLEYLWGIPGSSLDDFWWDPAHQPHRPKAGGGWWVGWERVEEKKKNKETSAKLCDSRQTERIHRVTWAAPWKGDRFTNQKFYIGTNPIWKVRVLETRTPPCTLITRKTTVGKTVRCPRS